MLTTITDPQTDWLESFNAITDEKKENILINTTNTFDEDDWTW